MAGTIQGAMGPWHTKRFHYQSRPHPYASRYPVFMRFTRIKGSIYNPNGSRILKNPRPSPSTKLMYTFCLELPTEKRTILWIGNPPPCGRFGAIPEPTGRSLSACREGLRSRADSETCPRREPRGTQRAERGRPGGFGNLNIQCPTRKFPCPRATARRARLQFVPENHQPTTINRASRALMPHPLVGQTIEVGGMVGPGPGSIADPVAGDNDNDVVGP